MDAKRYVFTSDAEKRALQEPPRGPACSLVLRYYTTGIYFSLCVSFK